MRVTPFRGLKGILSTNSNSLLQYFCYSLFKVYEQNTKTYF